MGALLREIEEAVAGVTEQVGPAVVSVRGRGRGSGVVVADGRVVTNAHNVAGAPVGVRFADGRTAEAEVTGLDVDGDLAVLDVDTSGCTPVAWGDGSEVPVGRAVLALAATSAGLRVTWGTVSATGRQFRGPGGRRISGALEHTAPLARGSSGGPVVDEAGRLLAINTHRLSDGFYLAVPADATLRQRVDALGRGEQPARLRLGLALAPGHLARELRAAVGLPEQDGLLVRGVVEDSPAGRAGVRQGDLLVEAGGRALATLDDVHAALEAADPESPLPLKVVRGTEEREVTVSFTEGGGP